MDTPKTTEPAVARDVAEHELETFAEAMDLDLDPTHMDDEDKKGLDDVKRIVLKAIQRGTLAFNDQSEPMYKCADGNTYTFKEPNGGNFMAMDRKKQHENVGKMYATMSEMAGVPMKTFATMPNRDLKVCTAVVTLFLA